MRLLTSGQDAERQKTGKSVVWLLEIDLPGSGGTLFFGTREILISGNVYLDKITNFSDSGKVISVGVNPRDTLGQVSGFNFSIRNLPEDSDRFSDIITSYGLDGSIVRFGCVFVPQGVSPVSADIIWYHTYIVDTYQIQTRNVVVQCFDIVEFFLNRNVGRPVTDNDFPDAPSESYGRIVPIILGERKDCVAIPVLIGARTLLDGSLLFNEKVISVVDLSDFPDPPPGGFRIQIIDEEILVRAVDRINNTFGTVESPCERGFGDTDPEGYIDGTAVYELRDTYFYLVADHKVKSINNVRIGGKVISSGYNDIFDVVRGQHFLQFTERPIAVVPGPGSAILRIDGSVQEDNVTPVWDWEILGDNSALDPGQAIDQDGLFTFATLDNFNKLLSLGNNNILENGEFKYGRFKKFRLGIEYFCSKRWGDETFPFFQLFRNGGLVGDTKYLQRPAVEDERVSMDEHDHREQSDWTIDDSTGLFSTKEDLDQISKSDADGFAEDGEYFSDYFFADINKSDGSYKIIRMRFYVLFDGFPLTATLRVKLADGTIRDRFFNVFSVPEEKFIVVDTEDIGPILFSDIVEGNVEFRVEGTFEVGQFLQLDGRLELDSQIFIEGQNTPLGQRQDRNRTEIVDLEGLASTSRVTQVTDYSVAAREAGGWDFINGTLELKVDFNNSSLNDDTKIYIVNVFFEVEFQPLTSDYALGELQADVEGWESYPEEDYYVHPVDILRYVLLEEYGGIDASFIDDTSFNEVRASVGAIAPVVGRFLGDQRTLREIVQSLLTDINCRLIFEGTKFFLRERKKTLNISDSVFDIDDKLFSNTSLNKERSSLQQIFNQLAIYWNINPSNGDARRCLERDDLKSQEELWGLRRETYRSWWFETNSAAINWIGDLMLNWGAFKYNVVPIITPLNLIQLERADIVQLTHERSGLEGQVCEVVGSQIVSLDQIELRLAFRDALRIFITEFCRVDVDRGGGWMKFYVEDVLVGILYGNGDLHIGDKIFQTKLNIRTGPEPGEGELFVCQDVSGIKTLNVPLPMDSGPALYPMVLSSTVTRGVILYCNRLRAGISSLSETIGDYVEWDRNNWVKLAPNGSDVVAKFEYDAGDDNPGIWTFKGNLKEGGL